MIWDLSHQIIVILLTGAGTRAGLICHNYTETYLYEIDATTSRNRSLFRMCELPKGSANCFEYAKLRNSKGALLYGAGCGDQCPVNGTDYDCKFCSTKMCNSQLAAEIRKTSLACYTGLLFKGAMSARRKRKVWCSPGETHCYQVEWIAKTVQKYFGGCGRLSCNESSMNCTYSYCQTALCNIAPEPTVKPCPVIGCGTEEDAAAPAIALMATLFLIIQLTLRLSRQM